MTLRSCIVSRPPIVVFVASLFLFAASTLILSIVVSSRSNIHNPDVLGWNRLLAKMAELNFCVNHASDPAAAVPPSTSGDADLTSTTSVSVPFSTSFVNDLRSAVGASADIHTVMATGIIRIADMDHGRLGRYRGMKLSVTMALSDPDSAVKSADGTVALCLHVTAPTTLLSDLNSGLTPGNCSMDPWQANDVLHTSFVTRSRDHTPTPDWCGNGTDMTLTYEDHDEWSVYLSTEDRQVINMHLLSMSAFLFALACVVMGAFCMHGCCFSSPASSKNKQFSTSLDDSGEMELLQQNG
jgi:hypothetical protein